ncbi:TIGR03364 family FAD-dependent oxidoreductase [Bosea rubneri]|uniref:TIGR03364 family FAD-dependent oxidoreductase n=1 Tax=Bosea rubneri TaxID=3075434 RepID=A0ABU3SF98_9HYPH|nr:TIGR03364 family FAD-dependent oxidoreductase [Bosea sp. ZW T0_25]MDU0343469.1 TIGR03364 family FAD-dependent oxidoreductase [Bosea sp. ZW T0_25]
MERSFDLAIVGAGIVGLAHALAAARRGLKVVVVDRDAQANGASVRNFGFVTVTGQQAGATWQRARRSREVWAEVAPKAGISLVHAGLCVASRRPEATAVLEAFLATEMGEGCELLRGEALTKRFPFLAPGQEAALWSPNDLRVESREAIPLLAAHLERDWNVSFLRQATVRGIALPTIVTSAGALRADAAIVCPGDDFTGLYADELKRAYPALTRCKLQMLRVRTAASGPDLPCAVMSDLSLVRYLGYAELPEAAALRARLEREQPAQLANGIHLIAVASADGSRVVGDSHHYAATPDPFGQDAVDALILDEYEAVFGARPPIEARWLGTYASLPDRPMLRETIAERIRQVIVTSGTGASTSFAIGEETIAEMFG